MQRFFPEMKERDRDLSLVGKRTGMTYLELKERLNAPRSNLTRYEREQITADIEDIRKSLH